MTLPGMQEGASEIASASLSPSPKAYVAPSENPWIPSLAVSTLYRANTCASAALMKATSEPKLLCPAGRSSHVAPRESGASKMMPACREF